MCGRFSLTRSADALAEAFQLAAVPEWTPRYNIAPTQMIAAIASQPSDPHQFKLLRWGLVPSWAKDGSIGSKLINARAETVAEKPSFRSAFKQRRCLILADGFYEWQRVGKQKKQPYYFQLVDRQPFAFAGLWERWQGEEAPVETCTVLTTSANELLEPIHDRMPVMLHAESYDRWLDPTTPLAELHQLLQPYEAHQMQRYPVSTTVNRATTDTPECINSL